MSEPDATAFVVTRDGVRLATDVYLPAGPGRVPAVIARTPYGTRSNAVWFPAIGRLFADHGMAFVAQDCRGHYASDGLAMPFSEASDGWDTMDWVTLQPWSDGSLAVFGESYVGYTAAAAAATGHPALRAAAFRNTGTDIACDWLRHRGVLRLEFVMRWAFAAWSGADNLAPEFDWRVRPPRRIAEALEPLVGRDRIPGVLDAWAAGNLPVDPLAPVDRWPSLIDRVRVPAHVTTGWWDLFVRGAFADWHRLAAMPGVERRLVAEATDHAGHDWGDGPTTDPLADFDALASRMPNILSSELAFLRSHLLGARERAAPPVTWMLTHAGVRESPTWPPPGATRAQYHLVDAGHATRGPEGGGLATRPDRIPLEVSWRHDPADPVPALEGEAVDGRFHRPDERTTQVRDDVLTFTADPQRTPLDLAGPVDLDLVVVASPAGGHVMAKLCDVGPDGTARRIADGATIVPGGPAPATVSVQLGDTGYRVRPGHRLRLEVAGSAYPRYIVHPGTSGDPWTAVRTRAQGVRLRLGEGSSLRLTTHRGPSA